ncbi:hypothetical protein AB0F96_38035 [Streptomyces sp. NPDC023998]|uniref:hypothetical protein n=1 Tax=Streptomyces sp. NPDC023998 TaxID=3154597 RepID=UPI0033F8049C
MGLGEALGVGELLALGDGYLEGVGEAGVDQVVVDQSGEGQPDHDGPGMIICSALPGPALPPEPTRHQVLDVVVLVALLAVCAGVYRAVGNVGFSVITGAVAGLYGTWRIRR